MREDVFNALMESIEPMDEVTPYLKAIIYGDAGMGKTVLAATLVEQKGLFVDTGEGWVALYEWPGLKAKLQKMRYQGLAMIDGICDAIEEGRPPFDSYDTIILDEASTAAVLDLDTVIRANVIKIGAAKDPDVATQPDYNANTERVRRSLGRLLKLPINVVLTAHVREDEDKGRGLTLTRPLFSPKLRNDLQRLVHIVGYLTMTELPDGTEKRELRVRPTRVITAKNRLKSLPALIENPDLGAILKDWKAIGGEVDDTPYDIPSEPISESAVQESTSESTPDNLTI